MGYALPSKMCTPLSGRPQLGNSTGTPKRGRLHSEKLGWRVQMYSSPFREKPVIMPPRSGVMTSSVFASASVITYCS